jgi:hypothetical protein
MKQKLYKKGKSKKEADDLISRKEALKKVGKYAAVTAASMFLVLSPKESQAQSPPPPGW